MTRSDACLFCEIQNDENDERVGILKRGEHWFVILNLFPYTNGHIMIVSNRHVERLSDVTEEQGRELVELFSLCERAVQAAYHPEGLNVGANLGASAGAGVVGHLHFHICPRWQGDTNFMTALSETRVVSEALEESYRKLAPHFMD
jgi:ATP adenylyltransferase